MPYGAAMLRSSTSPLLLACIALVACASTDRASAPIPAPPATPATAVPTSASVSAAAPTPEAHSIDLAAMDRSVSPGADFFLYANGSWLAKTEVPADRASTGVDLRLTEEVARRTSELLQDAARSDAPDVRKLGDYYAAYMDEATIESRSVQGLAATLARIAKVSDARSLAALLGAQLRADVDPLNATNFHTDHVLGLWGGARPERSVALRAVHFARRPGDARAQLLPRRVAGQRLPFRTKIRPLPRGDLLRGAGHWGCRCEGCSCVRARDARIAETHGTRLESEDVATANNVWSRADFGKRAPGMAWDAFFGAASLERQPSFIVWQPRAITGLAVLVRSQPLQAWKDFILTARAIDHAAPFLPKAIDDEHFAFYETELRGVPTRPVRWKRAVELTNDALGEAVGKVYVEHFFPPESKRAVERMVADIQAAFARRIDTLAWMSPATKAKAKEKLSTLHVGVGYPDRWQDDSALTIARDDALGNFERAELHRYRRSLGKLGKPVDRGEWAMVPQVVDAVNMPVRNAINFPAGILVAPYFDPQATAAANYGGIGAVIGHEISHSFDDQGSQFDAHGRLANWWTADDFAHFKASSAALATQFDGYKPLPDMAIDGKLTLSENIADLAGLAAAFEAWRSSLGDHVAPERDGLSGEQQFFLGLAQSWQSKEREPYVRELLTTNGHAPPHFRALTVRNLDAWYPTFGVKAGDALYLAPKDRVAVW